VKHKILAVLLLVAVVVAAGVALCRFLGNRKDNAIAAAGTIEVTEVNVTAKESGTLSEVRFREGDRVTRGQVLARLVRNDLEAQRAQDAAALERARAVLADLRKGPRLQEVREAEEARGAAQVRYDLAEADFTRFSTLYAERVISRKEMDEVKARRDLAKKDLAAAGERLSLVRSGTRTDVLAAQEAEVRRLEALGRVTASRLGDTVLAAPLGGLVLSRNYEEGEFLPAGAVLATVANLSDCWVKVYLPSTVLGRVKAGTGADVRVDSFPDRVFEGKVRTVSDRAEFTPRQSLTTEERANLVFAVEVAVDNAESLLKPGMPADVTFHDD
jgi:HlyD family secretion protein